MLDGRAIVSVVCHRDLVTYLMAVKSLLFVSKRNFRVFAIDDGSLTKIDKLLLVRIGQVNIIKSPLVKRNLSFGVVWQDSKYLGIKKAFRDYNKVYFIDSDIIFYKYPKLFLDHDVEIVFMGDYSSRYCFSELEIKQVLRERVCKKVNSGMFSINPKLISGDVVASMLAVKRRVLESRFINDTNLYEQTTYALLFSRLSRRGLSIKTLPNEYYLYSKNKFSGCSIPDDPVCIHYTNLFSKERRLDTIRYLARTRFLRLDMFKY